MALSSSQREKLQKELKSADFSIKQQKIHGSARYCVLAKGVSVKPANFKGKGSTVMPLGCFNQKSVAEQRIADVKSGKYKIGSAAAKKKASRKSKK